MAISILECDRLDRYQFEVFVGQVDLTILKNVPKASATDANQNTNCLTESRPKLDEWPISKPKYTVTATLEDVFQADLRDHDVAANDQLSRTCDSSRRVDSPVGARDSFREVAKSLAERYVVDETPVLGARCVCYNVAYKYSGDGTIFVKPTINRGVVCIFACVPKTLITILQKSPLELTVSQDLNDGDQQVDVGVASVPLSGPAAFTDAVVYHFYEKGYDAHTHVHDGTHDIRSVDGIRTVGKITVHLRLTCLGPETRTMVNQVLPQSRSDRPPPLMPVFIDQNDFDYPFENRATQPVPKVLYATENSSKVQIKVFNRDIKQMLHCQGIKKSGEEITCACPCKELLENVKTILFEDELRQHNLTCKLKASGSDEIFAEGCSWVKCLEDSTLKGNKNVKFGKRQDRHENSEKRCACNILGRHRGN